MNFFYKLWTVGILSCAAFAQSIIPVDPEDVINISTMGDASKLVDEQSIAGDTSLTPDSPWKPGWTTWRYPLSAIIDLKHYYNLSEILLFDANGGGDITFHAGQPFAWDSIANDDQGEWNKWKFHPVNKRTRYVMVTIHAQNVTPPEIFFYGTLDSTVTEAPVIPVNRTKPLMNDFVGLNGFIDDPIDLLAVGGFVREYHNWGFTEVDSGQVQFQHWSWKFDDYYANLKTAGIMVSPAIQGNVSFHSDSGNIKPVFDNEDPESPLSYEEHARHMYQYAARYGSTPVPLANITVNQYDTAKTALDLLTYYENWNEPDSWWHEPDNREGWFSPFEYSAMASADIDGHMGTMGDGVGLKTADPNAKMVMGGLALLDLDYVKSMMFWAKHHRNGDLPVDVLNFHHYSNDVGGQGGSSTGISPEADSLRQRIEELVDFRDTHLPAKELWITEFGYDTHEGSVQRSPAYGNYSAYEVQAMWLIRSYLAIAAGGADRAAMYMLRDVLQDVDWKYMSSGLTTEKNVWTKKDSWYYVSTFRKTMGNLRFKEDIVATDSNVWIYHFDNESTSEAARVVWCPTQNSTSVSNYELDLGDTYTDVAIIEFKNGDDDGDTIATYSSVNKINLNVSERPVIVKLNNPVVYTHGIIPIDTANVNNTSGMGDAGMLVDEQSLSGDPLNGTGGAPVTHWAPGWNPSTYPASVIIDFGNYYDLTDIFLRDTYSTGDIAFYAGEEGNWSLVANENQFHWQVWSRHQVTALTRYVKITVWEKNVTPAELMFYGTLNPQ